MTSTEEHLAVIKQSIIDGDSTAAARAVEQALQADAGPLAILNDALMAGADLVGDRFEDGSVFLPQLMLCGKALKAAMSVLEPELQSVYAEDPGLNLETGTVVLATVQSDIHDIGKNIVSAMLTAAGFSVHDLGVDVPIKTMVSTAREVNADMIACSALLTTSMPFMRDLIALLEARGERRNFLVMVGGAPITQEFCDQIGADGTANNAMRAVQLARSLMRAKRTHHGASS